MTLSPAEPRPRGALARRVLIVLLVVGLPVGGVATWLGTSAWTAWRADGEQVTGAVAVRRDGEVYITVSGNSEKTTERSDKKRSVSTTDYPRLTSYRARDGERVATRQYAPVYFRFEYVDTVVRALAGEGGRVWVMSTEPAVGLHAVDPVSLADAIDQRALVDRVPALAPGVFIERGASASPVAVSGRELFFRLTSGPFLALDPAKLAVRDLSPEGDELDEIARAGAPRGPAALEKHVEGLRDVLEPVVVPVYDVGGDVDPAVGFVVSQSSLDRQTAKVRVTRWDAGATPPAPGWTTTLDDVRPDCCQRVVWRADGLALLWYERWLVAFDDATGAVRWQRRL